MNRRTPEISPKETNHASPPFLLLSLACLLQPAAAAESPATVEHLRCEYRENPLGISVVQPRLFWQMNDARRGAAQTAYQVLVGR